MKKRCFAVLFLGVAMALSACQGSDEDKPKTTPVPTKVVQNNASAQTDNDDGSSDNDKDDNEHNEDDILLSKIVEGLIDDVKLEPMFEPQDEYINNYFGMDRETLEDSVFLIAESELSTETVIVIKASGDNKESVINSLNTYIEAKKSELNNYLPEQYDIAATAKVCTKGDYVYLVMSANSKDANNYLEEHL